MKQLSNASIKVKDGSGNWNIVPGIAGESAYEIAVRRGYQGTEAQWLNALETERAAAVASIESKGAETLADIPSSYTDFKENVVIASSTQPSSQDTVIWCDTSDTSTDQIPQIDDAHTSAVDTWSSNKINAEITQLSIAKQVIETVASTASDSIITITDGAANMPFKRITANIGFVQNGTGDQTSENVRTLSGKTLVNITVTPTNQSSDGETYKISFPDGAGVVGGGILSIDWLGNATLTITHGIATYDGSEAWKMTDSGGHRYYLSNPYDFEISGVEDTAYIRENFISSMHTSANMFVSGNNGVWGKLVIGNTMIKLLDSGSKFSTLAEFEQWLADMKEAGTPLQIRYPLTNPVVFTFTTNPITTTYGTNNIWSDADSLNIEYYADAKLHEKECLVPDYFLANDYMKNKLLDIESAMEAAGGDADVFFFLTDAHWSGNAKHSPALIKYINERIPIPRLFIGGDMGEGIDLNFTSAFKKAYPGKMYIAIGNHEYHNYFYDIGGPKTSKTITEALLWNYFNGGMYDAIVGNASRGYYYVDNQVQKMRYIVLNVYTLNVTEQFEADQQAWFANTALNMPEGYTAIVFAHKIAYTNRATGVCAPSETGTTIASIADAYSGSGKIAALICGHRHFDGVGRTTEGIPIFVTTCDKYSYSDEYDGWLSQNRKRCTISEQAFDVFVVDKKNQKVTAIRIGCPADNPTGTPLETREATYGQT